MLVLMLLSGLSLILYPTLSNYWNSFHQSRVVASYTDRVEQLDLTAYENLRQEAEFYNQSLLAKANPFWMNETELNRYHSLLRIEENSVMGSIEIPVIDIKLPIYHGTSETVLQVGVGHVEGTSLPIGGPSTHSVLSGHSGLPSALLFTNLDRVSVGDRFVIHILNEKLSYEVDRITIVEPSEISELRIVPEQDLCTLVTCTPYGINTHRLLVRGHRVENEKVVENRTIQSNARIVDQKLVFAILCAVPLAFWLTGSAFRMKKR